MEKVKDIIQSKIEKIEKKSTTRKGGARPNCGRKKGKLSQKALDKLQAETALKQVIYDRSKELLSKQMSLAMGLNYLYCDRVISRNKNGDPIKRSKVLITDPDEIKDYLNGEYTNNPDDDYYYITTSQPDVQAIKDLWDRAFGKPAQKIETDPVKNGGVTIGIIRFDS